ncbi:MAG: hypothetical protein QOJ99_3266, partial [Bryobacterales bacterium]|nr:hypothetical protein [Bryobacterales bacterium]
MNRRDDSCVPRKICHIQREQVRDTVDQRRGDQTCIIYLNAPNSIFPDQLPPVLVNQALAAANSI